MKPAVCQDLRLGFVTDRSAHIVDNDVWVDAGVGRMLSVWAGTCQQVSVAMAAAPRRRPGHDMRLELPLENVLPLPWMPTIARGFHRAWRCRQVIREVERRSDVVIVQLPFAAPLALLGARRPRLYHLCADIAAMARTSNAYQGLRRIPAVLAGTTFDGIQRRLVHSPTARVVTNGNELLARYGRPPGRALVSTTIRNAEIMSVPRKRPPDAAFRVLYVGYLRRAKGVDTLIDAFEGLLDHLPGAELVIAGPRDIVDHGMTGFLDEQLARIASKGTVRREGYLPFGPELFQQFADADVLALPSRSEGTPRVLVEARAFGCPVIGTRVGGIPTSITDGVDGLLVPPNNAGALRDAILRVARDQTLRQTLIEGGICRARALTVESFVRDMTEEIEQLLADCTVAP
jgi:glycosyltransferase involved in cell wall biosynthesis